METQTQDVARSEAEASNDPGKMFVGGLSWQTSPELCNKLHKKFFDSVTPDVSEET